MRLAYYVVPRHGAWAIRLNGKHFGPCQTKRIAIDVAISAAEKALAEGCSSRVLVLDGSEFQMAWEAEAATRTRAA